MHQPQRMNLVDAIAWWKNRPGPRRGSVALNSYRPVAGMLDSYTGWVKSVGMGGVVVVPDNGPEVNLPIHSVLWVEI